MDNNQTITTIANYQSGVVQSVDASYGRQHQEIWQGALGYRIASNAWKQRGSSSLFTGREHPIPRETLIHVNKELIRAVKGQETHILEQSLPAYNATIKTPITTYIHKVGVELEGGWEYPPEGLKPDGSVEVYGTDIRDSDNIDHDCTCDEDEEGNRLWCDCCEGNCDHSSMDQTSVDGEMEFGPYYPDTINWNRFEELYPNKVNQSCGMHTHISFHKMGFYNAFVRKEFQDWLMRGLRSWGEGNVSGSIFYKRLTGENHYCRLHYNPLSQIMHDDNRYSAVNYCFSKHGTMEIRVLPMFQQMRLAQAALRETYRLIHIWADTFCPKPWKPNIIASGVMKKGATKIEQSKLDTDVNPICSHCNHNMQTCSLAWRPDFVARLRDTSYFHTIGRMRCCECGHDLLTGQPT